MSTNPAYRIVCPVCGAAPWHSCVWTHSEKGATGAKRQPHKSRKTDGGELKAVYMARVRKTPCPQCGARRGNCKKISRKIPGGWEYCAPYGTKRAPCRARYAATLYPGMFDPEESAADGGLLVPPEFHESAAETGLLAEVPVTTEIATAALEIKSRCVGQQHFIGGPP